MDSKRSKTAEALSELSILLPGSTIVEAHHPWYYTLLWREWEVWYQQGFLSGSYLAWKGSMIHPAKQSTARKMKEILTSTAS